MKRITTSIPNELYARLDAERRKRDVSVATVVREALENQYGEPEPARVPFFVGMIKADGTTNTTSRDIDEILEREYADWIYESSGLAERDRRNANLASNQMTDQAGHDSGYR